MQLLYLKQIKIFTDFLFALEMLTYFLYLKVDVTKIKCLSGGKFSPGISSSQMTGIKN